MMNQEVQKIVFQAFSCLRSVLLSGAQRLLHKVLVVRLSNRLHLIFAVAF